MSRELEGASRSSRGRPGTSPRHRLSLAEGGAKVMLTALSNQAGLDEVAGAIRAAGGEAQAMLADQTSEESVAALMKVTAERFGRLDILVNNAAIRNEAPFRELSLARFREVMSVGLEGPFLLSKAAIPMLETSDAATIINIGGLTAYTGAKDRAHVVAAKAGLDGLTKAMAHDLAEAGITVNLVSPGMIETARAGHAPAHHATRRTLLGRLGTPEDIAGMVRYLAGPQARYVTGQTLHANGGVYLP